MSYQDLGTTLVQVYGIEGQAQVFRDQLKMVRRKKVECLTDLAMDIRRLMVMAFTGPTDRTTEIVARDVFLDAQDDAELTIQIHAQRPRDLESAVQIAQYMEAVTCSLSSRSSKPVRAVMQSGNDGRIEAELKNLRAGQRHLLDKLEHLGKRTEVQPDRCNDYGARPLTTPSTSRCDRRIVEREGAKRAVRGPVCFACGKEGHYARNWGHGRLVFRDLQVSVADVPPLGPASVRKNNSVHPGGGFENGVLGSISGWLPMNCLLDTVASLP